MLKIKILSLSNSNLYPFSDSTFYYENRKEYQLLIYHKLFILIMDSASSLSHSIEEQKHAKASHSSLFTSELSRDIFNSEQIETPQPFVDFDSHIQNECDDKEQKIQNSQEVVKNK